MPRQQACRSHTSPFLRNASCIPLKLFVVSSAKNLPLESTAPRSFAIAASAGCKCIYLLHTIDAYQQSCSASALPASGRGGGGRALLEWRGEGASGSRGGREGVQGGAPPPLAEMQHIHKELQKYTTLTHSELDDDSPLGADALERYHLCLVWTQDQRVLDQNMKQRLSSASLHPYPFTCHTNCTIAALFETLWPHQKCHT